MEKRKTVQKVNLEDFIEVIENSIDAMNKDAVNLVFAAEFYKAYDSGVEGAREKNLGETLLQLEQLQEKLEVAQKMLEKHTKLVQEGKEEFVFEAE